MRDLERLKDAVEYRVTSGQLRLAFAGGLALACVIFAVGVSVGQRLQSSSPDVAADDPLVELEELGREEQEAPTQEPPPLTYHSELTGRTAPARAEETGRAVEEPANASLLSFGSGPIEREPVETEPARPEPPSPGESSVFTLQVASFPTREEARDFARDLRSRGHSVFLVRTSTPERGTWFRVRVGPFNSRREAVRYQRRFESRERLPTFLVQRRR